MTEFRAVQLYDEQSADRDSARYICFSDDPPLNSSQFVIIECPSGRSFLGNVAGPNLNFNRNALSPTDNTAINQAEQIAYGKMARAVAVNEVFYYEIKLLKEIVRGNASSVRTRPKILSNARPATDEEIIRLLGLPEITSKTQIGTIIDTEVPMCVSKEMLMSHTLVAGTTGSGKTNTIANVVMGALNMAAFALLFDHKPDYQNAHQANDEGAEAHFSRLSEVEYWYVGDRLSIPGRKEQRIVVPARVLDPLMLAATIFCREGEDLQRDCFHQLLDYHISDKNGHWSLRTFKEWLLPLNAKSAPGNQNDRVLSAIQRKIQHPNRIPSWIDGDPANEAQRTFNPDGSDGAGFEVEKLVRPGHCVIVRIGTAASGGRDYGLLLSYVLGRLFNAAAGHRLPCPSLVAIDEAQDIFSADKSLRDIACAMLDAHVRRSRSKRIGYLFGVQSAAAVPDNIIGNLNSKFIHRHKNADLLRAAIEGASDDQRKMTSTFGPGECLAEFVGSSSIVHGMMRRSPFKLTKEEL